MVITGGCFAASGSTFNKSDGAGAYVSDEATLELTHSSVSGNGTYDGSDTYGGGLSNEGSL